MKYIYLTIKFVLSDPFVFIGAAVLLCAFMEGLVAIIKAIGGN